MKIIKPLLVFTLLLLVILSAGCISGTNTPDHSEFNKLGDHFYEVTYYRYDSSAMEPCAYYLDLIPYGCACSAVSAAGLLSHNYDFYYSEMPEIVVKVPPAENRYGSIGMATWIVTLTAADLEAGLDPITSNMIPYTIVDGINEKGVSVAINVVPAKDIGFTTGTNPGTGAPDIPYMCIPRLILDNCATAKEAVALLQNVNIYNQEKKFAEVHYLIADDRETYLIEIVNNELHITQDQPFMTNFYQTIGDYTPHAMGIERFNIIEEHYPETTTYEDMFDLMQQLKYTRKYDRATDPFWYSEYCADILEDGRQLNIYSPKEDYEPAIKAEIENYKKDTRDLDLNVWRTLHTAIYDLKKRVLHIYVNEDYGTEYAFTIPGKV